MKIYPHYSHESFVNSYLVGNEVSKEALIIDPGTITGEVIDHIEKNGYTLSAEDTVKNIQPAHLCRRSSACQ